jgi:hypothetical protein
MRKIPQKRRSSRFLLVGALAGFFATVVPASPAAAFGGGSGSAGDPYQISTCAHLLEIDDTTTNLSKSYLVSGDIDCNGVSFSPLINGATFFTGTFDGGNRTVSNLVISCATDNCGLFARMTGGTVKNFTFVSPSVTSSAKYVGLIAGRVTGSATVDDISVIGGSVTNTYAASAANHPDDSFTGGIVGHYSTGTATISDVTSSMTVAGKSSTGGIVGYSSTTGVLTIEDVVVSGNVSGLRQVGGVAGFGYNSTGGFSPSGLTVRRATVSASSVSGLGQSIGGILGYGYNILIENSISSADVSGKASGSGVNVIVAYGQGAYVGGLVGQISGGDSTISDSGSTGDVLGDGVDGSVVADGVGGVLGWARLTNFYVNRVFHVGSVTGARGVSSVNGMAGAATRVTDSYFRSDLTVTDTSTSMVGGMVGQNSGSTVITRSYFAGTQSGLTAANRAAVAKFDGTSAVTCSGFFFDKDVLGSTQTSLTTGRCGGNNGPASQSTLNMKTQSTFTGWDFVNTWGLSGSTNGGYPYLRAVTPDSVAPTLVSAELMANGTKLVLTFNEALNATTAPASTFTVTASAVLITPSAAVVNGSTVELTLPSALESSASITVAYVAPAANAATSNAAVQDSAGNDAASFSGRPVTNNSTADATAPTASWTAPSSPSSSRTLSYTLTFSESVTGIASGDFSNLGNATGCVFTPSAASTSTSITVSVTCTSDGTVIARLGSNTVLDAASNTGPSSGATASSVTIDTTPATTTTTVSASSTTVVTSTTSPVSQAATTTLPAGAVSVTTTIAPASGVTGGGGASRTTTTVGMSASATTVPDTDVPSDTTTTTVPASTTPTLPEIDVPDTQVGGAAALIGGVRVEASITREDNELRVEVGPIAARIWATSATGGKVPLDAKGRLRLQRGDSVTVDIEGFDANSDIEVRLYSEPVLLGRSKVGGSGTLAASYAIPDSAESGDHTVVLKGTGKGDDITLALSVAVGDEAAGINPVVIVTPIALAVLAALLLPVALRRRRRTAGAGS